MAEIFVPRKISAEMAAQGYNNEGRGELLGYIAVPSQHEVTCRYRITTGGDPDKSPHEPCTCRIGLWQETVAAKRVVNEMRKTARRKPRAAAEAKKTAKKSTKRAKCPTKRPKKRTR